MCVIDRRPRQLSPEQVEALALSRQVITQLELRNLAEAARTTIKLQQAEQEPQPLARAAAREEAETARNQIQSSRRKPAAGVLSTQPQKL